VKPAYGDVPERYKGRLAAIGSRQKYGVDYDEVFAPVPHQKAAKATLAEIASLDLEVIQFDIKTAFLYATLDKLIYMRLDAVLIKFGLKNSTADKCIYIRRTPDETTIVMIHVDDGIAASNKTGVLDNIGTHLNSKCTPFLPLVSLG
jgi:hypothetical protein